jgi:hypothetical protein
MAGCTNSSCAREFGKPLSGSFQILVQILVMCEKSHYRRVRNLLAIRVLAVE